MAAPDKTKKASVDGLLTAFKKDSGDDIGTYGGELTNAPRLATGLFPLDLALGGGFPMGKASIIWGPESSCVVGSTFIQYETRTASGARQDHKGGTLERLYTRFNKLPRKGKGGYHRAQSQDSVFYAACVNDEGRIVQNKIKAVVKNGVKPVFRVRSGLGFEVVITADHRFHTGDRYVRLDQLSVGDVVMVHNRTPYTTDWEEKSKAWRPQVVVKNHPYGCHRKDNGYVVLMQARFIFEARLNGYTEKAYRERLNSGDLTGLEFIPPNIHVHHKDEDFTNNAEDNLELIAADEHGLLHATERHNNLRYMMVPDTLVSIEPAGVEEVYDIEMAAPYPNFVADGFVVHNCKTNIALMATAMHQRIYPEKKCVFFDIEHSFDPEWAKKLGVNVDELLVMRPAYAEQMVDQVEGLLGAEDIGVIIIDSLAALVTTQESSSSAEKANVGGSGLVTGKLVRKTTAALAEAEKQGYRPTLFYINQIRFKIGVMFGDPETMPGGNAPKYQAAISLRVYGKNIKDTKISDSMPVAKEVSFIVKKWKCPIIGASGMFQMVTLAHKGLTVGATDDFNTISEYLKNFGHFEPLKKGYKILGEEYPTISAFKDLVYGNKAFGDEIRGAIISFVREQNGIGDAE